MRDEHGIGFAYSGWITKAFLAPKTNAELENIPHDPIAIYVTTSDPQPFSGYVAHHGRARY